MSDEIERRLVQLEARTNVLEDALTFLFLERGALSDERRRMIAILLHDMMPIKEEQLDADSDGYQTLVTLEKLLNALGHPNPPEI